MAKLTLTDGTIFEGTTEELIALTEKFSGKLTDPVAGNITHNGVEYKIVDRKAREGDVVIIPQSDSEFFTDGKKYGPVFFEEGAPCVFGDDKDWYYVYHDGFNRTTETVLVYEPKAEALKVGDYAIVIGSEHSNYFGGKDGDIVKVVKIVADKYFHTEELDGGSYNGNPVARPEALRKATDAEVAEAKASAERNAVFTQAGRKPNEYRKGDIVRITKYQLGHPKGSLVEVVEIRGDNAIEVQGGSISGLTTFGAGVECVEPIVFAESRLDLRK